MELLCVASAVVAQWKCYAGRRAVGIVVACLLLQLCLQIQAETANNDETH